MIYTEIYLPKQGNLRPAVKVMSPNLWTIREFPKTAFWGKKKVYFKKIKKFVGKVFISWSGF